MYLLLEKIKGKNIDISLCYYSPGVWNNKDIWGGCGGVGVEIWYHITRSRNIFKSKKRNFSSGWILLDSSCRYLLFAQNQMSSVSRIQKNLEIIYVHSCDINLYQDGPSSRVNLHISYRSISSCCCIYIIALDPFLVLS